MKPLVTHTGRAVPLRRSDVDTDQIIPAEYCRRLTRTGYADGLFARWRRDPGFVLNCPSRADATVLVAMRDFGTGSSREHAVWALRDWGFAVVIATSFGDIFRRNALKNGLLAVQLPEPAVRELADLATADSAFEVTVDLRSRTVHAGEARWGFDIDPRARWLLLNGYDDLDIALRHDEEIAAYERGRAAWLPTVARGAVAR